MVSLGKYLTPAKAQEKKEKKEQEKEMKRRTMFLDEKQADKDYQRRTMFFDDKQVAMINEKESFDSPKESGASSTSSALAKTTYKYPAGDFRNTDPEGLMDIKCDVMVNWLYQMQMEMLWTSGEDEGVVLKKSRGDYTCCPGELMENDYGFYKAIELLNVKSAMTVNTRVIKLFLFNNDQAFVPLRGGLRLQVLPDISYLPRCQKHQFAAFIADRGLLIVWDDEPRRLLNRAENIERALMHKIWKPQTDEEEEGPKRAEEEDIEELFEEELDDNVARADPRKRRRPVLLQAVIAALTMGVTITCIGLGFKKVALEIAIDSYYPRILFLLVAPVQMWLGLFFFQSLVTNFIQLLGPISQMNENSRFYSGLPPKRLRRTNHSRNLPHVTIQMPVYKEGLTAVIEPTIHSIKAAISTYEMQGGTANIFINDDGMQLIPEEEAKARQDFYDEHNIGWVSRPRHDPAGEHGEPFLRRGKFKKASNMNYSMWVSSRVEDKLALIERNEKWNNEHEATAYKNALMEVIEEDQGRTWADGNIRIGDYILIIDSDTRVPEDCLLDATTEMEYSPEVAILQFSSGVMNVTDSYFERGITFFTNLVYTQIKYAVANGDVAPFVGHNAFIRWQSVQSIGYDCELDGREKWWSEATVSEDFDMALRLQDEGYFIRMAAYTGDGFKEGVSLTVYDELARWEKYAYGCSELIFHPFVEWPTKGPLTQLFRNFLTSVIPLPSKLTIMAYIGTYYALASAWMLTLANYFIIGLFNGYEDKYYINSFEIFVAIIVVFTLMGNVALAVLRYRCEEMGLLVGFWTNLKWIPLLVIFLGGNSLHIAQALLSHMFKIDMTWGATAKELTNTTFFDEVPKVLAYKWTLIYCFVCTCFMIFGSSVIPIFWRIDIFIAIWPLAMSVFCHFSLPVFLNSGLLQFAF